MKTFFNATLQALFGSRYNKKIPRTYEAIVSTDLADSELTTQYLGDTICSLVNILKKTQVDPAAVEIYEIYCNNRESQIPHSMYTNEKGKFNTRTELCKMTIRYGKEEEYPTCSFQDRKGKPCGPYYDLV